MQDERIREDAKQLLRVARDRRVVDGVGDMEVDLSAAAEHRGLEPGSPHLEALLDFMEVAGWVEASSSDAASDPIRRVTARGLEVINEGQNGSKSSVLEQVEELRRVLEELGEWFGEQVREMCRDQRGMLKPELKDTLLAKYFVTMDIEQADPLLPVDQLASVIREAILPTVEALLPLRSEGGLVTGGYLVGERTMVFVFEADSEEEVREVLEGLPLAGVVTPNIKPMRSLGDMHAFDKF